MLNHREIEQDMPSNWAEADYRRLRPVRSDLPGPAHDLLNYYLKLGNGELPLWSAFDVLDAPRAALTYIALANPVYADPSDSLPDHFIYALQGSGVDQLLGQNMKGRKVGHVMHQRSRNSLLNEIRDALNSRMPVFSEARLDLKDRADLMFTRGILLFGDANGRVEKLMLYLQHGRVQEEKPKGTLGRHHEEMLDILKNISAAIERTDAASEPARL